MNIANYNGRLDEDTGNTFLFVWVKTLSNFYNLLEEKSSYLILEYIHDDEFLFNFFNIHFKNLSGTISSNNCNNIPEKYEIMQKNILKYFELFSFSMSSTKAFINKIFDNIIGFNLPNNCNEKENKIKLWKIIFAITFLEEFAYNKYIKLDENMLNMTNNSVITYFNVTNKNIPRKYKLKALIKSPIILKYVVVIAAEILNEIEVSNYEFQNVVKSLFSAINLNKDHNNESLCSGNMCYYNEEDYYDTRGDNFNHLYMNSLNLNNLNLNLNNSATNTNLNSSRLYNPNNNNININIKTINSPNSPNSPSALHSPNNSPKNADFSFIDKLDKGIINCYRCEELKNEINSLNESNSNLCEIIQKKEEEIKILHEYNLLLSNDKKDLECSMKNHEKHYNICSKNEKLIQDLKNENENLLHQILDKSKLIDMLTDKILKGKDLKNFLKESTVKNELLIAENQSLKQSLSIIHNFHIQNINFYKEEAYMDSLKEKISLLEKDLKLKDELLSSKEQLIQSQASSLKRKEKSFNSSLEITQQINYELSWYRKGFYRVTAVAGLMGIIIILVVIILSFKKSG